MKKDQYILAVTGILDRESATLLLRELESLLRTGVQRVTLAGRKLGPVLPEGVAVLRAGVTKLARELAVDASRYHGAPVARANARQIGIECVDLSDHASAQFLLNAVPVDRRCATLWPPADSESDSDPGDSIPEPTPSPAAARPGADGWLVDCWNCGRASRVRSAGEYACPVCGSAFRMQVDGEVAAI